jgi:hypothetical protein
METEVIDKLFLELSQVTRATTQRELNLERRSAGLLKELKSSQKREENLKRIIHRALDLMEDGEAKDILSEAYQ